jgi:hypothetical protein
MSVRGIELPVGSAVGQAEIVGEGFAFVVGHLGRGAPGYLTAARAHELIAAGLKIVSVFDGAQQRAAGGEVGYDPLLFEDSDRVLREAAHQGGVADGLAAHGLARAVGQEAGSAIYFEIDADVSAGIPYVLDYFRGVAAGLAQAAGGEPGYAVGVYGSGFVIDAVHGAGLAEFRWLAGPAEWQGSAGYAAADVLRSEGAAGAGLGGVAVSYGVEAAEAGFGQWGNASSVPNLVVNDLSLRATLLAAGGSTTIGFEIGNAGTAAASASTATLYLSDDEAIDAGDTVLGVFHVPSLGVGGAMAGSLAWTLPDDLAAGTYFIGVAAEAVPGEASPTDNAYAVAITVAESMGDSANLVINHLSLGAAAVSAGGVLTIEFEVGNAGAGAAPATTASVYLSGDAAIGGDDVFLGSFPVAALAPGGAAGRSLSATVPAEVAEGEYFIGVVAGPVAGESNPFDNVFATPIAVTAASGERPNLVIDHITLGAARVAAGAEAVVDFAVGNAGSGVAAASAATVYLSADATISAQDVVLGRFALPSLAAGASSSARLRAEIPAGTAAGNYFIGVVADPVAGEPNVFDNIYAEGVEVVRSAGSVSIGDVTVLEGDGGTTLATFVVTRSGGTEPFEVAWATGDGGATVADGDYEAASGTLAFDANVVVRTISVAVPGDTRDESDLLQSFFVALSDGTNGVAIGRAQGQGTIVDDDLRNRAPEIVGRDVRVHGGQAVSAASLVLAVSDADDDAIVQYAFRDSAAGGGHLVLGGAAQAAGTWATVAAGELAGIAYVGGPGEGVETIDLRAFDGVSWSEIGQATVATLAEGEDDHGVTPASAGSVAVGGFATGTVEAAGDVDWFAVELAAGERYRFELEGGATEAGTLEDPVLELRDGAGGSLELAMDDNGGEGANARLVFTAPRNDTFYLAARAADAGVGSYRVSASVLPFSEVSIAAVDAVKPEGRDGATAFSFEVARSGATGNAAVVRYAVAGSGAHPAAAADFVGGRFPSGEILFAAGEESRTLTIEVAGDLVAEETEAFTVTLEAGSEDVVVGVGSAVGVIRDDDTIGDLSVVSSATGRAVAARPTFYDGPVEGLDKEIILLTPENLNVTVSGDNWFIRTGSGMDALAAHGGRNVLDGGTGSNFLVGAAGEDTFFLDMRDAVLDAWSTVVGFGAGDSVTVWGVSPAEATIGWADLRGADGYRGLTMQASATGKPNGLVTLAGFSQADVEAGRLVVSFGSSEASGPYLHIAGAA